MDYYILFMKEINSYSSYHNHNTACLGLFSKLEGAKEQINKHFTNPPFSCGVSSHFEYFVYKCDVDYPDNLTEGDAVYVHISEPHNKHN